MPGEYEMNPSTFQQVRENMKRLNDFFGDGSGGTGSIQDIINRLESLEETINNIVSPDTPGAGDIIQNEDGSLSVAGVTIVLDFADEDTTPGAYLRDVTFELKNTEVVGLSDIEAFTGMNYAMVVTYKHNLKDGEQVDNYQYLPQQIAYGNNGVMYCRTASDTSDTASWGEWMAVIPEIPEQQKQWVQSETEPQNQNIGDYWCEPLS